MSDDADDEEQEERTQVNVRVSESQMGMIEEYIAREDTGQNTKSDLIRTATMDFISEGATSSDLDEIDAISTQLARIENNISSLTNSMQELQETQIDTDDVSDSVDSTVRNLLYKSIVNNDDIEGISLKDE
jgi:t-SNARE complex subunit (syntaxin)